MRMGLVKKDTWKMIGGKVKTDGYCDEGAIPKEGKTWCGNTVVGTEL